MSDEPENTEDHIEITLETVEKAQNDAPEVEIVDDQPEKQSKAEGKEPEAKADTEISPEQGIQELKKRLEQEKQARINAEKQAKEAHERALRADTDKTESQYQLVVNAIETVKERSKALEAAYAEAISVGDSVKAAEIVSAITVNNGQLEKLKDGKKAIKKQMKDAEEQAKQPIQPIQHRGNIVDQLIDSVSSSSRASAEWLDANRSHIRDERDVRKMFRAHEDAIDDGIRADTPEYFKFIEGRLGIGAKVGRISEEDPEPMSEAAAPTQRRSTQPPPAPVSRGTPRPNTMRLTRDEAETAKALGYTPEEYAKNKALLMKEGRYGH